jgi:iron complex outermembrane receptor protein
MLATPAFAQETTAQTNPDTQQPQAQPAQQNATTPGEPNKTQPNSGQIIVTGIRRSIQDSVAIKRRESSVVEAVSAEEIGKLPDVSIGESLARLPGVAAQRVGGRAEIISVRGFSPDFTTVLLNGRQQASSGYNRGVEFDQYPSELLGSVVVYKTPDADIAGMGLAGTVDMRTVRPLAYGKRAIALNLRGQYDEGGGRNAGFPDKGWRGSVSYIDQNSSGTLGWSIGYAHLDSPSHVDHTKNWYYENYGAGSSTGDVNVLSGQEIRASNSRDIRDGVMGSVEWKPSDAIHSVLDVYYSRFKQHTITSGAEWFADAYTDPVTISNVTTQTRDGTVFDVADHVDGSVPTLRWDDNKRVDHLFSIGLNNDFRLAERTHLIADLSYSSNVRDEHDTEIFGGYGVGPLLTRVPDSFDRVIPENGFPQFTNFGLNYADPNEVSLGDRSAWGGYGSEGHLKDPHIKETLASGDLTLKQDLQGGFFSSIEAGVDYTHRHKDKTVTELDLFLKNGRQQVLIDPQYLTDPTSLDFAGDMSVLGIDVADLVNDGNYYDVVQTMDANHFDKAWDIKEDITTFKVKANIDSGNLHGNVGVQVVRQRQESSGLRINTGVTPIQLITTDVVDSYTDVLPSLNLFYDFNRKSRLRLAVAKVMARPRMDDMRANLVPSFTGGVCSDPLNPNACDPGKTVNPWSATGGNPNLQPWRAKEVDVAYEWYGGKATYFSVNAFHFWLDNYIYNRGIKVDFSGLTPPPTELSKIPTDVIISPIGGLYAPANGDGGWVSGVEVSGAIEFGQFAPFLDGFGAQGSVSRSKYKLKPAAASQIPVLPGFSPWTYDITGYYEKSGFQARVSYRYRSAFQGEVIALFTNPGFPQILADKQMDAQIGYTFQPGSRFNGLGVELQVSNVLN